MISKSVWKLKNSIAVLIVLLFVILPVGAFARTFENVVAFGDSLSDHGGLSYYMGIYDPIDKPMGVLEVWSNGNTWVEYLSDELGATLDNNAIGGAMTLGHENTGIQTASDAGSFPQLGLVGQVNSYVGESPYFTQSQTLFSIWIGGNDFLKFGRGELGISDPIVMISRAMTNIQTAITSLYNEGAVNFLVLSLPDIGSTPLYNTRSDSDIATATALTISYNTSLANLVNTLRTSLSGSTIYYFDVFTYMNSMITNNIFTNVTGSYMELDGSGNYTGNFNGPAENYLFWDFIHPTTRAHEYVGKKVASTILASDDDDSTCFISLLGNNENYSNNYTVRLVFVFFIICIVAVCSLRKVKP